MKLRSEISTYLETLMRDGVDIIHAEAADQFVADHGDQLVEYVSQMVRNQVAQIMKGLCAQRPEDSGQLALLPGLPAAITVAPGVSRPLDACTWADLQIGRTERVENIAHAEKRLDEFDKELDKLAPHMAGDPEMTVADARPRLAAVAR